MVFWWSLGFLVRVNHAHVYDHCKMIIQIQKWWQVSESVFVYNLLELQLIFIGIPGV